MLYLNQGGGCEITVKMEYCNNMSFPFLKLNYNFAACKCRKREVNFHVDTIWDESYIHGRNNGKT